MKTELTIEESDKLIELGVDAKLASHRTIGALIPTDEPNLYRKVGKKERAFTLADILSILPKSYFSEEYYDTMNLSIETLNGKWFVNYRYYCGGELAAQDVERESPELIDALYQLLIWAIENGYVNQNNESK